MSERYSKLFTLPENLYTTGAPVVIAAGALLKDNQSGNVLAQLKLQNINSQTIKAATVQIFPMDTTGEAIAEDTTYQYLDLSAGRDTFFGQKAAIPLPNAATRSFSVIVSEVIFLDNTKWIADGKEWRPLKKPASIGWGDPELVKQFHCDYGETAITCFWRTMISGFAFAGQSIAAGKPAVTGAAKPWIIFGLSTSRICASGKTNGWHWKRPLPKRDVRKKNSAISALQK